jgi:F-type H+-transporting ATPase subunit b
MNNMLHDPKFWLAISFIIFIAAMLKFAMPAILGMIDNKVKHVTGEIMEASKAKANAEKLLAEAEKYYQESIELAQKLIADAETEAANLIAHYQKIAEEEMQRKIDLTTKRIQQEEDKAIREIKGWLLTSAITAMKDNITKINDKKTSSSIVNKSIIDVSKLIN